jgi:hypothetical protein
MLSRPSCSLTAGYHGGPIVSRKPDRLDQGKAGGDKPEEQGGHGSNTGAGSPCRRSDDRHENAYADDRNTSEPKE